MNIDRLDKMTGGWFVGDFSPAVLRTAGFEVGVKHYKKGDHEATHHHRVAEEITCLVKGKARIGDYLIQEGDIVTLARNEAVDFEALEDSITVIVKVPSVMNDKFPGAGPC